jgi:osmotically-inducible protein OsmY
MRIRGVLIGGTLGAALVYLLDPDRGHARRARLRDQLGARVRDGRRAVERTGRQLRDRASAAAHQLEAATPREPEDDLTVLSRVESVLFGMPGFPKESVNAEVVDGRLTLRGQVPTADDATQVAEAAARIRGVVEVRNLLHVPGEEAPNKAAARRVRG